MTFPLVLPPGLGFTLTVAELYNSGASIYRGWAANSYHFYSGVGGSVSGGNPLLFGGYEITSIGVESVSGAFSLLISATKYPADAAAPPGDFFSALITDNTSYLRSAASSNITRTISGMGVRQVLWSWPGALPASGDKLDIAIRP